MSDYQLITFQEQQRLLDGFVKMLHVFGKL